MLEHEVLKWAAGAEKDLADIDSINVEKMLDLVARHRIAGRFLQRITAERPKWCNRKLLIGVWSLHDQAKKNLKRQLQALEEMNHIVAAKGHKLILLKGPSIYSLTGDNRNIRFSDDLDLFCSDLEFFWETLQELGYEGNKVVWGHEFAAVSRGGVSLEPHKFMPVVSYPEEVMATHLTPAQNPGRWIQNLPIRLKTNIRYATLIQDTVSGRTPETNNLTIPSASMSALILCANVFRDYSTALLRDQKVRLAEIADIYDLSQHPEFDENRFLTLSEQLGINDSVRFVAALFQSYFQLNPLPVAASEFQCCDFPQILYYSGPWVSLCTVDDLLIFPGINVMVDRLGANTVVATHGEERVTYSGFATAHAKSELIKRVIVCTKGGEELPFEFYVTWNANALSLGVSIREALRKGHTYLVRFRTDGIDGFSGFEQEISLPRQEAQFHRYGQEEAALTEAPAEEHVNKYVTISSGESGCEVRFSLPWSRLPGSFRDGAAAAVPILLSIGRCDATRSMEAGADPMIIIPLRIVQG